MSAARDGARIPESAADVCRQWADMGFFDRDGILSDWMDWARSARKVELELTIRNATYQRVTLYGLESKDPGKGNARAVMDELCRWADCAQVVLELAMTVKPRADADRLRTFFAILSFSPNVELPRRLLIYPDMIRYPALGAGHERCARP